jgi:hypothetical protein
MVQVLGGRAMSIATHYCPKEIAPLYFEDKPSEIRFDEKGNAYCTSVY